MNEFVSQTALADHLGISQAWLSEATSEGKTVAGGTFDPAAHAVYDDAGRLVGYDVDDEMRREIEDRPEPTSLQPTASEEEPMLPSRAVDPTGLPARVYAPHFEEHHEETQKDVNVSLLPPGTNLSKSSAFLGASYAAAHATQANPTVAPQVIRVLATATGAFAGYQVDRSAFSTFFGATFGFLVAAVPQPRR